MSDQDAGAVAETLRRIEAKLDLIAVDARKIREFRKADGPRWARLWRQLNVIENLARRGSVW